MKRILAIVFYFLLISGLQTFGQAIKISCTEVMPDGNVLVSWDTLNLGSSFSSYKVYSSDHRKGPYTLRSTITVLGQGEFLHVNAGANTDTVFYYIYLDQGGSSITITDTLATMLLSGSTSDFEQVDFAWTPLHEPAPFLPAMHPEYYLFREYPAGTWAVLDSTVNQFINYHFWDCNFSNDTVRFKIGVRNNVNGCFSFSNEKKAIMKNQTNRYPPVLDSVSITAGGEAVIGWEAAEEPDIVGYKIFSVTSTNDSIDYVAGRLTTSYLHRFSQPCLGPLKYIILSVDTCGNESPFPFDSVTFLDKPHSTIYLEDIQYDPCMMSNLLIWNEYKNFEPSLGFTNIYASENSGPFELIGTVLPGQSMFIHENLLPNTWYSYYIRAYSTDTLKSSTSCQKTVRTYNSPRPLFMYTRYVTVEDNIRTKLLFYTDTNAHVQYYRILRSISESGPYDEVGRIDNTGQEYVSFADESAVVEAHSYYYQIEVTDSCGIDSVIANTVRSIHLETEALPDMSNSLTWNAYESWSGRIEGYRVYRRLDNGSLDLLADLDSLTFDYTDNISSLTGNVSRISYLVEAYEGDGNIYGFRESSYSNEVISEQKPRIYVPNAFTPRGLNNVLLPVFVFVGAEGYEFQVYNRWGQLIFRTEDQTEGWDGKYNGNYVPQDVYVYLVRYYDTNNKPAYVRGNVAVIY